MLKFGKYGAARADTYRCGIFILVYSAIHYVFTKMAYNMSTVPAGSV